MSVKMTFFTRLVLTLMFMSVFVIDIISSEKPTLVIVPESPDPIRRVALGQASIFTCQGRIEVPERLQEMRWFWPDGKPIELSDSRVETLAGDPGSLSLYFSSVQEQDLGVYRCTVTYASTTFLNTSFVLSTFVPITFEDAPVNQYAVKNKDYKVRCRVKADPAPQIDWKKDHRPINGSDHYIPDKDGMVIRGVSEADEGIYTCRVKVISLGKVEERHIQLEVHEKPKITSAVQEAEGVEEESLHIACTATGKPSPEYIWANHRGEKLSAHERFVVDKYKGTLQIDHIKREDDGVYTCTAENSAGSDTVKVKVDVVTKPIIDEFKNITSQVKGNAVLTCRSSGDPAPDIHFHKDSQRIPFPHGIQEDKRIFSEQRKDQRITVAQLKISDLVRSDDGLYNCIASNKRTKTELLGHLTVEFPPSFEHQPMRENWSWDGKPANVTCLAEGIPNATISWFIMGNPERPVDKYTPNVKQIGYQSRSSLEIRPIDRYMYGFYKCVATNKLGNQEYVVQLREARKPGYVLQVLVHEKSATSISFKIVGPADDGGLPVTHFVGQYKEDRAGWDQHKTISWAVDQQVFIVGNLEPLRTYYFRFAAENLVGIGEWAHERVEVMPKRSAPEPPPILNEVYNGVATSTYSDRFELRWTVPPDNGEKIEVFEITYYPVRHYRDRETWESIGQERIEEKPLDGRARESAISLATASFSTTYLINTQSVLLIVFCSTLQILRGF